MLPSAADPQNLTQLPDIKEAYPLIESGLLSSEQWMYLWIGVAILLTLCVFYGIYRWMKRPQPEPVRTPIEHAWEQLNQAEHLLSQGELKTFSQTLSLALRTYIEACYRIPALELTTEEFAKSIRRRSYLKKEEAAQLIQTLEACDTLKFSTVGTDKEALQAHLEHAQAFIRSESEVQEAPQA